MLLITDDINYGKYAAIQFRMTHIAGSFEDVFVNVCTRTFMFRI